MPMIFLKLTWISFAVLHTGYSCIAIQFMIAEDTFHNNFLNLFYVMFLFVCMIHSFSYPLLHSKSWRKTDDWQLSLAVRKRHGLPLHQCMSLL